MSKDIEKYTNWRAITESDYVTMFIKTWFAFVATLRSLYPEIEVFADDGKPRGDRPFTNKFKESDLVKISQDVSVEEFSNIICKLYVLSREKFVKIFPQYFFSSFYKMNEDFHYQDDKLEYGEQADGTKRVKDRVHIDIVNEKRWDLSINFQINGEYSKKNYRESIKIVVNVKDIINSIDLLNPSFVKEDSFLLIFYKRLYDEIERKVNDLVSRQDFTSKYNDDVKMLVESKIYYCLVNISKLFDYNKNTAFINDKYRPDDYFMVIKQRPMSKFSNEFTRNVTEEEKDFLYKKVKEDIYIWFIDFVVGLRNALFHEIIDPLDEEWQLIYKNAYLALKELLDATTNYLIKNEVSTFIESNYIDKDNEELFDELKTSLESEAFDLADYELIDDDIVINQIDISGIDFYDASSIIVNNKRAKFRCRANILADGRARVFDYNLSQYDKEDDTYYNVVHDEIKFNNAEANVELKVEFEFDLRDIERTARICNVKPLYFGSIRLSLSNNDGDNDWKELYPYEDEGNY